MQDYIQVATVAEMPASGKLSVEVGDRYLLIVRVEQQYYCIDDVCTHDGGELGAGELNGFCIACPRHGAQFDVRNGKVVSMPATEDTGAHSVHIDGDRILVRLSP